MRVEIIIGDWSDDGHGKCDHIFYEVTHPQATTAAELRTLIATATAETHQKTGLARPEDIFQEYQEHFIPCASEKEAQALADRMNVIVDCFDVYEDHVHTQGTDGLAKYVLHYAKFSLPDLTFKRCENSDLTLRGYGYGMLD